MPTNPSSPMTLNELLALDVADRRQLADAPDTDPATLRMLVLFDLDTYVRELVAGNKATRVSVLKELLERRDATSVMAAAFQNPSMDPEVLSNSERWGANTDECWMAVASNPSTPPEHLAKFTDWRGEYNWDEWCYVDVVVAAVLNPSTPLEAVENLSDCGNEYVEDSVAERLSDTEGKDD